MVTEAAFTRETGDCPHPEWWHAPDNQATETEVVELLAAFVGAIQPEFVLETGSHRGFTTLALASAIAKNGHGQLVSLEVNEALHSEARERVSAYPCAEVLHLSSLVYTPSKKLDFVWLDSGGGVVRYEEFIRFFPWFHANTIIGIHDTAPHQGDIPSIVESITRSGRFLGLHLPTPRGVTFGNPIDPNRSW